MELDTDPTSSWALGELGLSGHHAHPGSLPQGFYQGAQTYDTPPTSTVAFFPNVHLSVSSISLNGQVILPRTKSESFEAFPAPPLTPHLQTTSKSYGPTFKAYPESDHFSSLPLIQENALLTWMTTKPSTWS